MTKIGPIFSALLLCLSMGSNADEALDGASLYSQNCASCHGQGIKAGERIAPPIVGVKDHYLLAYADKESFVNAVVNWVREPATGRSLMPGAISRFGIMPALPYPSDVVASIAAFIYEENIEKPGWYEEHFNKEHGSGNGGKKK